MDEESRKTVLVTDDDPVLRDVTVKLIAARGHKVLTADSGEQAIEIFASGATIDLHVLDVVMQGIDGFETMGRLRDLGYGEIPVVFLTGKSSDDDILDGYRAGAGYYVTKPFKPAALLNIVDFLIGDLSPSEREKLALRL